jgi:LmbE family N-acetylglucosaminyl deacetylase
MFRANIRARVLAIGAHPDDVELGAGGLIHRLVEREGASVALLVLTEGAHAGHGGGCYDRSVRRAEATRAAELLGVPPDGVCVLEYPDCRLHEHGHQLIEEIEGRLFAPDGERRFDVVLTHAAEDSHADHRTVHEATLSAVRGFHGSVLLYQSPSTKPNGFRPTFFVELDRSGVEKKQAAIHAHVSQRNKVFMGNPWLRDMGGTWATFLRLPGETHLEAFEIYKSFF